MANLIYSAIASLDGFTADADGNFDWAAPDEEVHSFVNDQERPIGTYLYGRRMYQTMVYWETAASGDDPSAAFRDYARIWRAADKVVYSSTLDAVNSARTRLERTFDPDAVRRLKSASSISTPSWWAVGHEPCPPVCASSWSCWTSAASATAWSTCATGSTSPSLMV